MNPGKSHAAIITGTLMFAFLSLSDLPWAASPSTGGQQPATAASPPADDREDQIVTNYLRDCGGKAPKNATCDKLKNDFVAILQEDLLTLGSTADRQYLPDIVRIMGRKEVELRLAAPHAIGMIGLEDSDVNLLLPYINDRVPDVRHAVANMIPRGKGKALELLKERIFPLRAGREVEKPVDPSKYSMPVAPASIYIFDSSDPMKGRLSYVTKGKSDPGPFFKAKAKKGPYKWDQFKELYRYQLQDEDEALNQAQQVAGKQLESEKPPDPATNMEAYVQYMQKLGSVSTQGSMGRMHFDAYQSHLYGGPTVYVLEERQIGQRSYPTRYAVVYQELAFKRPGYRLAWTTVPDDALKAAQVASLKEQKEEEALKATTKREEETAKKREAELDSLTKKKDATEKKQFKKGQSELEKELGF
jgi:hypothetical protein